LVLAERLFFFLQPSSLCLGDFTGYIEVINFPLRYQRRLIKSIYFVILFCIFRFVVIIILLDIILEPTHMTLNENLTLCSALSYHEDM